MSAAPELAVVDTAVPRVSSTWLGLREAADAAARAAELVDPVRRHLAGSSRVVIHDLGCGTGSMARWLAPQLPGRQHWILCDRDEDLLEQAAVDMPGQAADGAPVTVETRQCDITRLTAADFAGAGLVTASALLDMLTVEEVERIVAACVGAGSPALLTISVIGRVNLTPADPLDAQIAAAFNAHQRRTTGGRRLLGPDAVAATLDAFARRGASTTVRPSAWRLGADDADLVSEWFAGWLAAACEQRPELAGPAEAYGRRRLAAAAEGRLEVVVGHHDLLAICA
jgi:trans-aconitate methyltransferase